MSFGFRVNDATGALLTDITDKTTRYLGSYSFSTSSSQVVVSVTGVAAGTHFAIVTNGGFPVIEANQVRIYPAFSSGGSTGTLYVFRI